MTHIMSIAHLTVQSNDEKKFLNDISFCINKNEVTGIFGPSGSGKSTLLKTLVGLSEANFLIDGQVSYYFDNEDVKKLNTIIDKDGISLISPKLSYIPQNAYQAFDPIEKIGKQFEETFLENQIDSTVGKERIKDLFFRMDLSTEALTKYPFQLSGGMLQRCIIALCLSLNPECVIADEPTSALDSINKKKVIDLFLTYKKEVGKTLILSTHDISVMDSLCDYVIVLDDGKKIEETKTCDIDNNDQSYIGKVRKIKEKIGKPFWRLKNG